MRASFIRQFTSQILEPPSFSRTFPSHIPKSFQLLTLIDSWICAREHKVLRFQLPSDVPTIKSLGVPSGVKVRSLIGGKILDKSYSPISLPSQLGYVDLLVKRYPFNRGGGLGAFLYNLHIGDSVEIKFKPEKLFSGIPYKTNRWSHIVLIGNGTGNAPLFQMALHILTDRSELTRVHFVSQYAYQEDILLKKELDTMEHHFPDRLKRHTFLSRCSTDPRKINLEQFRSNELFPNPIHFGQDIHAVVCGTDGFLETVCGGHVRVTVPSISKKKKQQGPILGFLGSSGWTKEQVTKL